MPKTILIVDDEPEMLEMLRIRFEAAGFEVKAVATGEDALDKITSQHFDLVLLDVLLPRLDGFGVCQRIKANPRAANTLVVFLSAFNVSDIQTKAAKAGGDAVFLKPFEFKDLLSKVKELLKVN